jgi:hypothetical protein
MTPFDPAASGDNDGHRFAPSHRDGDVFDANRNGISADDTFVQHLDLRAFDEAEFDQPAFKLGVGQCRACLAGGEMLDHAGEAAPGKPERQLRLDVAGFGHGL